MAFRWRRRDIGGPAFPVERFRSSEARPDKWIDEVREEIKEVRAEIKALDSKLDRVLESLLAVKS